MYNMDDILSLMIDGKSANEIADEFTAALNEAIVKYEDECSKRCKKQAMNELIYTFMNYLKTFYPELHVDEVSDDFVEVAANEMIENLDNMVVLIEKLVPVEEENKKVEDPFAAFFKAFNL